VADELFPPDKNKQFCQLYPPDPLDSCMHVGEEVCARAHAITARMKMTLKKQMVDIMQFYKLSTRVIVRALQRAQKIAKAARRTV
jgi:hypothetical protein